MSATITGMKNPFFLQGQLHVCSYCYLLFVVSFPGIKLHLSLGEIFFCFQFKKKQMKTCSPRLLLFNVSMPEKSMAGAFSLVHSPDGVRWWRVNYYYFFKSPPESEFLILMPVLSSCLLLSELEIPSLEDMDKTERGFLWQKWTIERNEGSLFESL